MATANNPYPAAAQGVDPGLIRHIRQASLATNTDFGLLMAQAKQESGFKPDAKAATGSAAGLFQFIDSTWLDMVRQFGAKHGAGDLAQQITLDASGKPQVSDAATRQKILALRADPQLSASLAGEYAKQNQSEIERALGHPVGRADVYMAHFLGAGGATQFLKALASKGDTPAADLLPDAAQSNRAIFYDGETGRAKSVAEIYRSLGQRIEQEAQAFSGAASTSAELSPAETLSFPPRLDIAGLRLSQPVASMLDIMAVAALKLVGDTSARNHRSL
jgi:hypothetical protein